MTSDDASWAYIWLLLGAMPLSALFERLHAWRYRRRRGQDVACFGCIRFAPVVAPEQTAAPAARDAIERATVQAIDMLPCAPWHATGTSEDCALCLEPFRESELILSIPVCGHSFHRACAQRWLVAQRYKTRRCPLCNADPLQVEGTLPPASSTSSSAAVRPASSSSAADRPPTA